MVYDADSHDAVVIDPVLDYDPNGSQTSLSSVDKVTAFLKENGLRLRHSGNGTRTLTTSPGADSQGALFFQYCDRSADHRSAVYV